MTDPAPYMPGPAAGAEVRKHDDKWTLILVRELHHPPEAVWEALTDPAQLREWAPFDTDKSLAAPGTVNLQWVGAPQSIPVQVTRAEAPKLLEYGDARWQLEPTPAGTRLTLWHALDHRFISMGAAGWHIAFDVLDRHLAGRPIPRIAGAAAMQFAGWQRLNAEYAQQFGIQLPKWPS
jgi:uncharacterized protein YndB with AHSA1/START domain